MNARFLTATALAATFAGIMPARAADQELLKLLMPDAKVVAGVNVDQAKASPFGQYILSQMMPPDPQMRELNVLTGFDPTRDVRELLVASTGAAQPGKESGLALARGNFNIAGITNAVTQHGANTESYGGVTIVTDPGKRVGIAFVNTTLVIAGDLANVKAAIDRQSKPASLSPTLLSQINEWSNSQDAWLVTSVPPGSLVPRQGAPKIPGVGPGQDAFQAIQQAAGGVRFGSMVSVRVQGITDTAQNAQQMGDAIKLLASLAQMQGGNDPVVKTLVQSLNVSPAGNQVNVGITMPSDQLIELVKPQKRAPAQRRAVPRQQQ